MIENEVRGLTKYKKQQIIWLVFLLAIELTYVLVELGFNSALLNLSGGLATGDSAADTVEVVGRTLSGIGFGLVVFSLFRLGKGVGTFKRDFPIFAIAIIISTPVMYIGQDLYINTWVIDKTTGEDRHSAHKLLVFKDAVREGNLRFGDSGISNETSTGAAQLTYLSILPALLWNSEGFVEGIQKDLEGAISEMAKNQAQENKDAFYDEYRDHDKVLDPVWESYQKISRQFKINGPRHLATSTSEWNKIQNQINEGWKVYKNQVRIMDQDLDADARRVRKHIGTYIHGINQCSKDSKCRRRYDNHFDRQITPLAGRAVPLSQWCSGSTCPGSHQHIKKVLNRNQNISIKEFTGFPYGIRSIAAFRSHPLMIERMKTEARKAGIELPANWNGSKSGFDDAVKGRFETEYFNEAVRDHNIYFDNQAILRLGLPRNEFELQPKIQNLIKSKVGSMYHNNFRFGLSKADFTVKIFEPNLKNSIKEKIDLLSTNPKNLAEGGYLQKEGRNYVRAIIIPPMALFLSLLFSSFALLRLPLRFITISWIITPETWKIRLRRFLMVLDITAVLSLPVKRFDNDITDSETVQDTISLVKADWGDGAEYSVNWLLRVEPILYPIGQELLNATGLDNRDKKYQ